MPSNRDLKCTFYRQADGFSDTELTARPPMELVMINRGEIQLRQALKNNKNNEKKPPILLVLLDFYWICWFVYVIWLRLT